MLSKIALDQVWSGLDLLNKQRGCQEVLTTWLHVPDTLRDQGSPFTLPRLQSVLDYGDGPPDAHSIFILADDQPNRPHLD